MAEKNPVLDERPEEDAEQDEPFDSPVENAAQLISTQTLHQLRTTSLSSFTKCRKKIEGFIEDNGNVDVLKFLRTALHEAHGDCEAAHNMFRERHEPFETQDEEIKFDMWMTSVDTKAQETFNAIEEHLASRSSIPQEQQNEDVSTTISVSGGARPRTIMTRGASKRTAQLATGNITTDTSAPLDTAAKKVTFDLPAATTTSDAPQIERNPSSAPSTSAATSQTQDSSNLFAPWLSWPPPPAALNARRFGLFDDEPARTSRSLIYPYAPSGSRPFTTTEANRPTTTLYNLLAARPPGSSASTVTTSVYSAVSATRFGPSLPAATTAPSSRTIAFSPTFSRQTPVLNFVSQANTDQLSRLTSSPPRSSSMPLASDSVASQPLSQHGPDQPHPYPRHITPPFSHGFIQQHRPTGFYFPNGPVTMSPFSQPRSNASLPSGFHSNFAALTLHDGYPVSQPPASLNHQAVRSPTEDWISNLGSSTWRDSSPSPPAGIRPPKLELKPFSGLAKDWPVFSSSFKLLIYDNCRSDAERLHHLRNYLPTHIRESLGSALLQPHMFNYAMQELQRKYGSPQMVSMDCIAKLLGLPSLKEDDLAALKHFSSTVRGAVATLAYTGHSAQLECHSTLLQLLNKLPSSLRREWGRTSYFIESHANRQPTLSDFDDWLDTTFMQEQRAQPFVVNSNRSRGRGAVSNSGSTYAVVADTESTTSSNSKPSSNCPSCQGSHLLESCGRFKNLEVEKRAEFLRKSKICFRCLKPGHASRSCSRNKRCTAEGCKFRHHPLVHGASFAPLRPSTVADSTPVVLTVYVFPDGRRYGAMPIVQAIVRSKRIAILVYALLDQCSQVNMIHQSLAEQLGLKGPKRRTKTGTFHGDDPVVVTRRVSFELLSTDGVSSFFIEQAESVPVLNITRPAIDWSAVKESWPHLKGVPIDGETPAAVVTVLIGLGVTDAHDILEVCRAPPNVKNAPKGILTPFGWVITGEIDVDTIHTPKTHAISVSPLPVDGLPAQFERWCRNEMWGTNPVVSRPLPVDDRRAQAFLEHNLKHTGTAWETALLWKQDPPILMDNYQVALKRFKALERRFNLDPAYAASYTAIIEDYFNRGFSRLTTPEELENALPNSVNYIPHHGVTNPNKPGKIRVVFDASAKFRGQSLNDHLFRGIDYLNALTSVLTRFRQHFFAVSLDIEKMFHMVKVRQQDQAALRYLWKRPGSSEPPTIYQMQVMPFGLVCSPSVCFYLIRRTASENERDFPGLTDVVASRFYADNYLDSFDSVDQAIQRSTQLQSMLKRGGFNLNQLVASDRRILAAFPGATRSNPNLDLDLEQLPVERALGQTWNCESDSFILSASARTPTSTRRQMLSVVAGIFDPLGFMVPVTVAGKRILQESYRDPASWDDVLNQDIRTKWDNWTRSLNQLAGVSIPRCFKPSPNTPSSTQLHGFSDASMTAFCAVVYIRFEFEDDPAHVAIVAAKSKLAPLKDGLLIHRLELDAALLLYRLMKQLKRDLDCHIDKSFYWSDNTTVLRQIYSKTCRFEVYQANRLGEILEESGPGPDVWQYVPTDQNPADDGCRGIDAATLTPSHRWLVGPSFLRHPSVTWPVFPSNVPLDLDASSPGVRSVGWVGAITTNPDLFERLIDRSSSILFLCRTVAWIFRFACHFASRWLSVPAKSRFQTTASGPCLSVSEILAARRYLIRLAQEAEYFEELKDVKEGRSVSNTSRLLKASPFIDGHGLLRVGGRLHYADAPFDVRHPVILPRSHRVTKLIVRRLHAELGHASVHRTLARITEEYYIPAPRSLIKSIIHSCSFCIRRTSKPVPPLMADLPFYRAQGNLPVFYHCGVDMFGPMEVIILRRRVKRYGFLFTCLNTRTVKLEVGHSADLSSFLMAMARFRKGPRHPAHMYSDNGSNFVAASKELRDMFARWNKQDLVDKLSTQNIQWHFNPPAAPHFGGAWERLIRSAKVALEAVLHGLTLTDEVLLTAMTEVEEILNSRPLTYLSVDPTDMEVLTPNHLLFGRAYPCLPFDVETNKPIDSRKRFQQAQAIATHFNHRWRREYLPNLIERRKWLKHRRNVKVGDLVLIVAPCAKRHEWPRGRVVEVYPDAAGTVRSVLVKTADGVSKRPVVKLCLLEEQLNEDVNP